jgi:hypothetical protein
MECLLYSEILIRSCHQIEAKVCVRRAANGSIITTDQVKVFTTTFAITQNYTNCQAPTIAQVQQEDKALGRSPDAANSFVRNHHYDCKLQFSRTVPTVPKVACGVLDFHFECSILVDLKEETRSISDFKTALVG